MTESVRNGWYALSAQCDVQMEHDVPVRVACSVTRAIDSESALAGDIHRYTGLHVALGPWGRGERPSEREAPVQVESADFDAVLERYARASAATYWDRYQHAIRAKDDDYETEAYALDFVTAMQHCHLDWGSIDKDQHYAGWRRALHVEAQRLADSGGLAAQP